MANALSIIIVNWNTREMLGRCLASVFLQNPPTSPFESWVVDNASTDGSPRNGPREVPPGASHRKS